MIDSLTIDAEFRSSNVASSKSFVCVIREITVMLIKRVECFDFVDCGIGVPL